MDIDQNPRSIDEVLISEFKAIHGEPVPKDSDAPSKQQAYRRAVHGLAPRPDNEADPREGQSAICFSGGGIRSATFCLGVIQALAEKKWLDKFHYMSSVSGGGYIASWLSSWITHRGNLQTVLDEIAPSRTGNATRPDEAESPEIRGLRAYSNYLSPIHGFSLDLLTLVATFIRNLSLHWLVMLPLLVAVVMLPRLNLAMTLAFSSLQEMASDWGTGVGQIALLAIIPCMLFAATWLISVVPPAAAPDTVEESQFGRRSFLPLMLLAVAFSWCMPLLVRNTYWALGAALLASAILTMLCIVAATQQKHSGRITKAKVRVAVIAGIYSAALLFFSIQILTRLAYWSNPSFTFTGWYSVLSVPVMLIICWSGISLYVGLARKISGEDEREWWARACAWIFWAILGWIVFNAVVIFGPYLLMQTMHTKEISASAGVLGVITGAYGYWSKQGRRKVESVIAIAGERALELAAAIFILALLISISFALALLSNTLEYRFYGDIFKVVRLEYAYAAWTRWTSWHTLFVTAIELFAIGFVASYYIGTNTFSLHNMYGNRLVRAYLGSTRAHRNPDPFTGFDPEDNVNMSKIAAASSRCPRRLYHVINIALNMVKPTGKHLDWQQRKAASFIVTPHYTGSACTDFQPSASYSAPNGISLARAMTISGAAASPNMGYHSSTLVAFVMTFFNVRLGWWLPNPGPAGRRWWNQSEPPLGALSIVSESLAETTDQSKSLYLSDGGHFENLGLYEMVRRRCHKILVVDASCDPNYEFEDLENAIRKIRVDFGIAIEFPGGLPTPAAKDDGKNKGKHAVHGTIRYKDVDGTGSVDGHIIYVKPIVTGDEPLDIGRYAEKSRKAQKSPFPHHSTGDQFFDEIQFESYRQLGYHSIMADFPTGERWAWPATAPAPQTAPAPAEVKAGAPASDKPEREHGAPADNSIMDAMRRLSQSATLWTAVTISGTVSAVGTLALKGNPEIELKKGAEISISASDMATLSELVERSLERKDDTLLLEQIQLVVIAIDKLKADLTTHSGGDLPIVTINNTLDKQVELIRQIEQSRDKEHITLIKDTIKSMQATMPNYTEQLNSISGSLVKIEASLASGLPAVKNELRRANVRSNVSATQEGRP